MSYETNRKFVPIAIVGVGALFPASRNATQFWQHILSGKDLITDVPPGHWLIKDYYDPNPAAVDKTYCKRGAFLPDIEFDPIEFGIPPTNIPAIDTAQLLALVVAKQVLQDTSHDYMNMDLSRVSVILGGAALEALQYVAARMQRPVWTKALQDAGVDEKLIQKITDKISNSYTGWQENTFPGLLGNVVAGRVANRFNLGGTNCVTDAACAGSLAALSMSINELQLGQCDMSIVGGVDTLNDIVMYMCFSKTQALSFSGDCRPFSDKADGTVLGEGIAMFALKRLEDAEKNNDKIYAVIRGIGTSSDGRSKSIYAPLPQGQAQAIKRAYQSAGYKPSTLGLVEAHGTGTRAGDAAEFAGLTAALNEADNTRTHYCALGSIKSQIGHTKSAAGSAGLFKAIMALHHKVLPPTIKVDKPNPELDWNHSPLYLNTELRPWVKEKEHPRRAGVSSFGFGGSNFHVALEEYQGPHRAPRLPSHASELIILAAESPNALMQLCQENLVLAKRESLNYIARTSQENINFSHLARLAIIANDPKDLEQKLRQAIDSIKQNNTTFSSKEIYYAYASDHGRIAFLFPGRGSEYLRMGAEIATSFDQTMAKWDNKKSLADVLFPKPVFEPNLREKQEKQLTAIEWAQPAIAVTSLMYLTLLKDLGIEADYVSGHHFGELIALHAAGAINENDLLTLAQQPDATSQKTLQNIRTKPSHIPAFSNQPATIEHLCQQGVRTFIEVGPQNILTALVKTSPHEVNAVALNVKGEHDITQLWRALGQLFTLGLNPNFKILHQTYQREEKQVAKNKAGVIYINGTNYAKPYPEKLDNNFKSQHQTSGGHSTMSQSNDLLHTYQELHRQLIEAHNTYQKMMADTHISFLNAISQITQQITSPNVALPIPNQPVATTPPLAKPAFAAPKAPTMMSPPAMAAPVAKPAIAVPQAPAFTPPPVMQREVEKPVERKGFKEVILDVVVEKTGYPKEMLNMDMSIETELGIDSIKRVEILSALTAKIPNFPKISADQLTSIQTLGDMLAFAENRSATLEPA